MEWNMEDLLACCYGLALDGASTCAGLDLTWLFDQGLWKKDQGITDQDHRKIQQHQE